MATQFVLIPPVLNFEAVDSDLLPTPTATYDIGSASKQWVEFHSTFASMLQTSSNLSSWGAAIPAISINGNSAAAGVASGAGLIFDCTTGANSFFVGTSDKDGAGATSSFYWTTGNNAGTDDGNTGAIDFTTGIVGAGAGNSGYIKIYTGSTTGTTSGAVTLESGAAAAGASGDVNLVASASAVTQGRIVVYARTLRLPTHAAAPTATEEGEVYYNTTTDKSYTWDGSTWQAHF